MLIANTWRDATDILVYLVPVLVLLGVVLVVVTKAMSAAWRSMWEEVARGLNLSFKPDEGLGGRFEGEVHGRSVEVLAWFGDFRASRFTRRRNASQYLWVEARVPAKTAAGLSIEAHDIIERAIEAVTGSPEPTGDADFDRAFAVTGDAAARSVLTPLFRSKIREASPTVVEVKCEVVRVRLRPRQMLPGQARARAPHTVRAALAVALALAGALERASPLGPEDEAAHFEKHFPPSPVDQLKQLGLSLAFLLVIGGGAALVRHFVSPAPKAPATSSREHAVVIAILAAASEEEALPRWQSELAEARASREASKKAWDEIEQSMRSSSQSAADAKKKLQEWERLKAAEKPDPGRPDPEGALARAREEYSKLASEEGAELAAERVQAGLAEETAKPGRPSPAAIDSVTRAVLGAH